jgi:hypothetical protein
VAGLARNDRHRFVKQLQRILKTDHNMQVSYMKIVCKHLLVNDDDV